MSNSQYHLLTALLTMLLAHTSLLLANARKQEADGLMVFNYWLSLLCTLAAVTLTALAVKEAL